MDLTATNFAWISRTDFFRFYRAFDFGPTAAVVQLSPPGSAEHKLRQLGKGLKGPDFMGLIRTFARALMKK
jgi:hypothetical protein